MVCAFVVSIAWAQQPDPEPLKAKEFFGKACDSGSAAGCDAYAILNKK